MVDVTHLLSMFTNERTMANIIAQRDDMILQLSQTLQQVQKELDELKKSQTNE